MTGIQDHHNISTFHFGQHAVKVIIMYDALQCLLPVLFCEGHIIQQQHLIKLILLIVVLIRYLGPMPAEIDQDPIIRPAAPDQPVLKRLVNSGRRSSLILKYFNLMTLKSHQVCDFRHHAEVQVDAV